jgi:excisionase family DNA binding protein
VEIPADGSPTYSNGHPQAAQFQQEFAATLLPPLDGAPGGVPDRPDFTQQFLTVREVARELRVCTATVYSLCEKHELAHVRVSNAIRVPRPALATYLRRAARIPTRP